MSALRGSEEKSMGDEDPIIFVQNVIDVKGQVRVRVLRETNESNRVIIHGNEKGVDKRD